MRILVGVAALLGSTVTVQAAQPNWAWSPEFYYTPNAAKECELGNRDACGDLSLSTLPQAPPPEPMAGGGYGYRVHHHGRHTGGPLLHRPWPTQVLGYLYLRPNPHWAPPPAFHRHR